MSKLNYYDTTEPRRFSPTWWGETLRRLVWVSLITVLIWVYADLEFTDVREFHITLKLATAADKDFVLTDRRDVELTVRVRGNWAGLDHFEEALKLRQNRIQYDPSETYALGSYSILTSDIFNRLASQTARGVTVVSCQPAQVDITLARAIRTDVPVKFSCPEAIVDSWWALPAKVSVRASVEQWQKIHEALKGEAAAIQTVPVKSLPAERPLINEDVELVPALAGVPVEVSPPSVRVTVRVAQKLQNKTLQVAVQVLAPPTWSTENTWKDYTLEGKEGPAEWQKTIEVSGPRKDIDQLTPARVHAYILLTDDDKKPTSWWKRDVVVRFPEDLSIKLVGPKPVVNFRLTKTPAAAATPAAP